MKRWTRYAIRIGGALLSLVLIAVGAVYAVSSSRLATEHVASAHAFDAASGDVLEGEHLVATYGCMDCHGDDLGGTLLVDGMPFARIPAPNLTSGRTDGGLTDEQWEVAVRHGIGTKGQALIIMPSPEYVYLSDEDLAAIVAYVRTLPPVRDKLPTRAFGPVGRTLIALGKASFAPDLMPADARHLEAPEKAPTREFGFYLTRLCTGCHGQDLAGGPPMQPDAPAAPDLTRAGTLSSWSYEQFVSAMRTGVTPEGKTLNPQFMPWTAIASATDIELRAIWEYLSSVDGAGSLPATE